MTTMATMVAGAHTVQLKRLIEFASDVLEIANDRPDLELRELIDSLHADLIRLTPEED